MSRKTTLRPARNAGRFGMVNFMRGLIIETLAVALLVFLYLTMQASADDAAEGRISEPVTARAGEDQFGWGDWHRPVSTGDQGLSLQFASSRGCD